MALVTTAIRIKRPGTVHRQPPVKENITTSAARTGPIHRINEEAG